MPEFRTLKNLIQPGGSVLAAVAVSTLGAQQSSIGTQAA